MPSKRVTMTYLTSTGATPLIVIESLIHRVTPCRNVPTPSVTISELIRNTVMKNPFTRPTSTPVASAISMHQPIGTWCRTLRTAITIDDSVITFAIETSKSFAVSGMISPNVTTTSTACEPRSDETFDQVRKVSGFNAPNATISAAHTTIRPYCSAYATTVWPASRPRTDSTALSTVCLSELTATGQSVSVASSPRSGRTSPRWQYSAIDSLLMAPPISSLTTRPRPKISTRSQIVASCS